MNKGFPGPALDAWMLKFQPGPLAALGAPSLAPGWDLVSGGHSDGLPEVSSAPRCVSGAEDHGWHTVDAR